MEPYRKRFVCLANSFKTGGACVAGREALANGYGGWFRPISVRETAELRPSEARYRSWATPRLLDIVDVHLLRPAPHCPQIENHIIDASKVWNRAGRLRWSDLAQIADRPSSLWINRDQTATGVFNCLSSQEAATQNHSLLLIEPESFAVTVGTPEGEGAGRKPVRASFTYNGIFYRFSLTDPAIRKAFAYRDDGDYPLSEVYLCLSLTERYNGDGRCHKLVAAVLSKSPL